ncbi:hypothetical protein AB0D27_05175 [Streptomyces sp. NPDC048415]|jgi:hypothetical protein|uniref:hypothetical protein n=1 Tax=Streptomyces sp. NPDC048415 TaxID=3154822 RepID=UPI0034483777
MHAIRVASAALLGITAVTITAPAAFAGDGDSHNITPFGFSVGPSTITAGGQVSLLLSCDGLSGHTALTVATGRPNNRAPVPVPAQRGVRAGVRAGVGGSVGGFDLKEIGRGAVLIAGCVGTAWYLSRRRIASDDS